jgi:hypothetical protein
MWSVDCHEPTTMPTAPAMETGSSALALRRLALSLAPERGGMPAARRPRHESLPTVAVPPYSRIVFRAGAVSVR